MKMKKINVTETIVADIQLHIVQNGSGGPVIFWGMYPHQGGEIEHFWEALMELVLEQNFLLVAFLTLGSSGGIWNRSICRTRREDIEVVARGRSPIYQSDISCERTGTLAGRIFLSRIICVVVGVRM
mgnify:CR=1 FL=1